MSSKQHKKLSINAISNLGKYVVNVAVTFFLTPFVIHKLGNDNYGLWVVVLSLVGYSGLLEMGVQTSVIKLVAQYNGIGDVHRLKQIISASLAFFIAVGTVSALALWFATPLFLDRLVSDPAGRETVRLLLIVLGVNVLLVFPNYVFSGVVFGLQAYHRKNLMDVGCTLVNATVTYVLLNKGYGLIAVVLAKVITDLLNVLITFVLCIRICPHFRPSFSSLSKDAFKELFAIGGKIFSSSTMYRIANSSEPLIISSFLGTSWTAIASVSKRLIDYIREISLSLTTGFMPMFSELQAKDDLPKIRETYFQYSRYILIIVLPIIAFVFVYGTPFIRLWVGGDFADKGKYLITFLTIQCFVDALQPLAWRMLVGVNETDFIVRVSVIGSILYIVIILSLIHFTGINGIGISGVITAFIAQSLYFRKTCNYLNTNVFTQLKELQIWPITINLLFALVLYVISSLFPINSYFDILLHMSCGIPFYILATYFVLLRREERLFLCNKLVSAW